MSTTDTSKIPNSLQEHWMPFTSNRDFKENPRLITEAKGVYLKDHHGRTHDRCKLWIILQSFRPWQKRNYKCGYQAIRTARLCSTFQQGFGGSFELARKIAKHTPG